MKYSIITYSMHVVLTHIFVQARCYLLAYTGTNRTLIIFVLESMYIKSTNKAVSRFVQTTQTKSKNFSIVVNSVLIRVSSTTFCIHTKWG